MPVIYVATYLFQQMAISLMFSWWLAPLVSKEVKVEPSSLPPLLKLREDRCGEPVKLQQSSLVPQQRQNKHLAMFGCRAHDDHWPRWLREFITRSRLQHAREAVMGSFKQPRVFKPVDLEVIDQVYIAVWAQVEAREPVRDRKHEMS